MSTPDSSYGNQRPGEARLASNRGSGASPGVGGVPQTTGITDRAEALTRPYAHNESSEDGARSHLDPAARTTTPPTPGLAPEPLLDIEFLRRLVEIPSLSGEERAAAAFLRDHAASLGLRATIDDAGNFVASTQGDPLASSPATHDIVLLGHMDVVPGDVPVRIEGDLLYGRGSVDAKGPLAAFLLAAARVKDSLPSDVRLVVIGAVEEEAATSKGARAAVTRYQPSACLIGEPSGQHGVTIGYKGRLLCSYTLSTSVAHTAGPQLSVGDQFAGWWQRVLNHVNAFKATPRSECEGPRGPFASIQATIRSIRTTSDGLNDLCEATVAFRLPPDAPPTLVREWCERANGVDRSDLEGGPEAANTATSAHAPPAALATLSFVGAESAIVAPRGSSVVRALTGAIRAHQGRPALLLKTGTSDMNVVADPTGGGWTCPIAAYGPGDSALDHTPNEHVSLTEFRRSIDVLAHALRTLAAEVSLAGPPQRQAEARDQFQAASAMLGEPTPGETPCAVPPSPRS